MNKDNEKIKDILLNLICHSCRTDNSNCYMCIKRIHANNALKKINKQVINKYKRLSIIDPLTELYNRRKLEEDIDRYCDLIERHKLNFSIAMIDIDNFKKINDTKGHKKGDLLLQKTAKIIKKTIRKSDRAYRIGGDEFIIIYSHHKDEIALRDRLYDALDVINIKISIGIDDLKKNSLEVIDKKMYEDKKAKNK